MLDQEDIKKIKETAEDFFQKMTITPSKIEVNLSSGNLDFKDLEQLDKEEKNVVNLDIKLDEPQILIGEKGQTLFEIQRLLRMVLNKKLSGLQSPEKVVDSRSNRSDSGSKTGSGQKVFYLNLDINDYKNKKVEYLKGLAKDLADEVSFSKEEKSLLPMSSYERRIIHTELSQRQDVITESRGEGFDRHIVIKPH